MACAKRAKHGWLVLNKTTLPFPWKMLWEALDENDPVAQGCCRLSGRVAGYAGS
jgi:hypothetical protein